MIKKHYYTWNDVENMCTDCKKYVCRQLTPDYIVGIHVVVMPATIISNMTGIRCEALKVSLRDDNRDSESNVR